MKNNNKNNNVHYFLDIDGVLATTTQFHINPKKYHPKHDCYPFDKKCVAVFNEIIAEVNPIIILSSTWRKFYTIDEMNEIFEWNGVNAKISDVTPSIKNDEEFFTTATDIYEKRASEILDYLEEHPIEKYIVLDDYDLSPWITSEHFVRTPKENEGIKQSGVKEKILKISI